MQWKNIKSNSNAQFRQDYQTNFIKIRKLQHNEFLDSSNDIINIIGKDTKLSLI